MRPRTNRALCVYVFAAMECSIRRIRCLFHLLALVLGTAVCLMPASAEAAVKVCLEDNQGNPLRFVWVQHWFTDRMTNVDGCVTFDADGEIDIRVFAHNPVVRMDDGLHFTFPVSQELKRVSNGQTRALPAQNAFWRIAEHFRHAYNHGLREFAPWNDAKFPAGRFREPTSEELLANLGAIRATWPDQGPAVRAWTEGAALTTVGSSVYVGFPLVHLKLADATDHTTIAHELGHALHFSKLPNQVRMGLEASYGAFLLGDADQMHCFDKRTNKTVAWIEAFGIFAEEFEAADGTGATKHANFFDRAAILRRRLLDGEECGSSPATGAMFGPDVEGAIFVALFHDFARHPSVGLPLVVESYVTCQSMDIDGYASCIRDRHGPGSPVYRALLRAAGCNGIALEGEPQPVANAADASDSFGTSVARGDFNGDGFEDLAIGAPGETFGSLGDAGMVNVLYGMPGGLSTQCNQAIAQDSPGVPDSVEAGDRFGEALATGDFDGDGFTDLAISAPSEDLGSIVDAGWVTVLRGSVHGLLTEGATEWWESKIGLANGTAVGSAPGDHLGLRMTAGDFNGDGADDLAMSVTGEDIGVHQAGAVLVVYGQKDTGLQAMGGQLLTQPESPDQFDYFGSSLAAGDFDHDDAADQNYDDLAVGANGETVGTSVAAGAVSLFYGGPDGLSGDAARHFSQDSPGIAGIAGAHDLFGTSLAFGDFDHDGHEDLAIGVPGETVGGLAKAGAVAVLYGSSSRTATPRNELWTEDSPLVAGEAMAGDAFGQSVVTADFDGDEYADLAVGIPGEDFGEVANAGAVTVLHGAPAHVEVRSSSTGFPISVTLPAGLDGDRSRTWSQSSTGIADTVETDDRLGSSLTAGDFDRDGLPDLAIGVPFEDVGSVVDAGAVTLIRGSATGLVNVGDQFWHQDR